MTPGIRDSIIGLIGLLVIGLGVVVWSSHNDARKAQAAQSESNQLNESAHTLAAKAAVSDQQATQTQASVAHADAIVASAKRELDRRLAALHGVAPASIATHGSEPWPAKTPGYKDQGIGLTPIPSTPDELTSTRAALVQAQQVITAQDEAIKQRDQVIAALTASRDQWKAAYEESQKALALQKLASEAEVHSEAKRGFLHSLETGVVCAALGYVGGRH